jgi:hypothetical protein
MHYGQTATLLRPCLLSCAPFSFVSFQSAVQLAPYAACVYIMRTFWTVWCINVYMKKKALSHCIRMLMHYCSVSRVITSLRFSGFQKLVPSQDAVVRLPRLVAVPAETGAQGLPERL